MGEFPAKSNKNMLVLPDGKKLRDERYGNESQSENNKTHIGFIIPALAGRKNNNRLSGVLISGRVTDVLLKSSLLNDIDDRFNRSRKTLRSVEITNHLALEVNVESLKK